MGEVGVTDNGAAKSLKNRQAFYSSGVDKLARFVDKHTSEIRLGLCGVAILGVAIIGRSVRIFSTFHRVDRIPSRFIEQHVRLRGCVRRVGHHSTLFVEHIPIIRLSQKTTNSKDNLLPVSLAGGINILESGQLWLAKHLTGHLIWFKPLRITNDDMLECIVHTRMKWSLPFCVNKELVTRGFAMIATDKMHRGSRTGDAVVSGLEMSLVHAELVAQRRGRGVWFKRSSRLGDFLRLPVTLASRVRLKIMALFKR